VKKLRLFLVRLVVISLVLVPALAYLKQGYQSLVVLCSAWQLPTADMLQSLNFESSGSVYTFMVLLLAIPGLTPRRRALALVAGCAAFLLTDCFMNGVWLPYLKSPRPSLANMAVSYGWIVVAHYLLPFLLWIMFAFRQIVELCPRPTSALPAR
jgi:hypothetical protein